MRTRHGFLAVSAALNKWVPRSGGIETTQFHSVLLCCQLAFSIPLSPQKPQYGSLAGMLYNRSFHSCFGTCNPGLAVPRNRESTYPRVWCWRLCSGSRAEASRSTTHACREGRGMTLGRTIPAAPRSALDVCCMYTVPGTEKNTQSLPFTQSGLPRETENRTKRTYQGSWL